MLNVKLIAHTPEPERVVSAAARLCYSAVGVDALLADQGINARDTSVWTTSGSSSPRRWRRIPHLKPLS